MTRESVRSSGGHSDFESPGNMLNQMAYTRTSALGYLARRSFCTHRVPATQTGHVGDNSKTNLTLPTSRLNIVLSSSRPRRSWIDAGAAVCGLGRAWIVVSEHARPTSIRTRVRL